MTLHHWQQLARPNLGGILVPRPGVLTKDFRQLDIDLEEVYSLTDLEEDEVEAASFQLLPTSTPAKAKERPGGERGDGGRQGPRHPPALLLLSPLAPPCPLANPLSVPAFCPCLPVGMLRPRGHAGRGGSGREFGSEPPLSGC